MTMRSLSEQTFCKRTEQPNACLNLYNLPKEPLASQRALPADRFGSRMILCSLFRAPDLH